MGFGYLKIIPFQLHIRINYTSFILSHGILYFYDFRKITLRYRVSYKYLDDFPIKTCMTLTLIMYFHKIVKQVSYAVFLQF